MSDLRATPWPAQSTDIAPARPAWQTQPNTAAFNTATIWGTPTTPIDPQNPQRFASLKAGTKDEILLWHGEAQKQLTKLKGEEMLLREACAILLLQSVAAPKEGVNNVDIGGGFVAKVTVNNNYKLKSRNPQVETLDAVDTVADKMAEIDNEGSFIAERLFKWSVDISVSEYKKLVDDAKTSRVKATLLELVNTIVEIDGAAPKLEIKEAKAKK